MPPQEFEELNKMDYKEEGKDRPKGLTISFIVSSQATALQAQETRVCMINRLFKWLTFHIQRFIAINTFWTGNHFEASPGHCSI